MLGIECCVLNCVDSESERILRIGLSWGWLGAGQRGAAKMNFPILTPTILLGIKCGVLNRFQFLMNFKI